MADYKKVQIVDSNGNLLDEVFVKDEVARNGLAGKVNKSGDTMTGNLGIEKGYQPSLELKQSNTSLGAVTLSNNQIFFREYPADQQQYSEVYRLPIADSGLTATKWYDILTSKNPVAVAQGGTGGNDSGLQFITSEYFTGELKCRAIGKFGMIFGTVKLTNDLSNDYIDFATIPTGYRPSTTISGICGGQNGWGVVVIDTSGKIRFYKAQNASWSKNWNIYFTYFYVVD